MPAAENADIEMALDSHCRAAAIGFARERKKSLTLEELVLGAEEEKRTLHEPNSSMHTHHFDAGLESFDYNDNLHLPRKANLTYGEVGPHKIFPHFSWLDEVQRESLFKWFLSLIIAVIVALTAGVLILSSHHIVEWKVVQMHAFFTQGQPHFAFVLWFGYGICSTLIATMLVTFVQPAAGGSGIPDVKAYCNGNLLPGVLRFETYLCRVLGLIMVTSSGLFAGTEGPMAHVGAITAAGISMGRFKLFGCQLRLMNSLNTHQVKLEFMSLGAAVGVAAAFGAPIGGLLFSLEEASSFWTMQLTWRTYLAAAIASLCAKVTKTGFQTISLSGFIEFPDQDAQWRLWELIPFTFIAIAMGLVGAQFCWSVRKIQQLRMRVFRIGQKGKLRKWARVSEALAVSALTMMVIFLVSTLLPCTSTTDPEASARRLIASKTYDGGATVLESSHCSDPLTESSGVATVLFESREHAIKVLFSENFANGYFEDIHLVILFFLIYILTLATYGCSIPAGLFIPNIMVGACFGRLVGQIVARMAREHGVVVNPGVYALMGSTGLLAGFSRMTVSLGVIVLEVTTNMRLVLPIMLVIMISKNVGDMFTHSAYDIIIALKNIPLLEQEQETQGWRDLSQYPIRCVGTAACDVDLICFNRSFKIKDAVEKLTSSRHHAWPVVDNFENKRLLGLLNRTKLLDCLEQSYTLPDAGMSEHDMTTAEEEKMEEMLNIWPSVDRYPSIIMAQTPVRQAYRMFRVLGLRHLCVVDERHGLLSFITRTDLAEVVEEFVSGHKQEMRDFAEALETAELDNTVLGAWDNDDSGSSMPRLVSDEEPERMVSDTSIDHGPGARNVSKESGISLSFRNISKELSLDSFGLPSRTSKEITRATRRDRRRRRLDEPPSNPNPVGDIPENITI